MIRNAVLVSLIAVVLMVGDVFACLCGGVSQPPPANNAELVQRILSRAEVVFIGKVTGFEYRKGILNDYAEELLRKNPKLEYETQFVKFEVKRWWKGVLGPETELISQQTRLSDGNTTGTSCNYNFKEGETYLVFANHRDGRLTTNNCLPNGLVDKIKDIDLLGEGNAPVKQPQK